MELFNSPICQEEMMGSDELTHCARSCGNVIHIKCMKVKTLFVFRHSNLQLSFIKKAPQPFFRTRKNADFFFELYCLTFFVSVLGGAQAVDRRKSDLSGASFLARLRRQCSCATVFRYFLAKMFLKFRLLLFFSFKNKGITFVGSMKMLKGSLQLCREDWGSNAVQQLSSQLKAAENKRQCALKSFVLFSFIIFLSFFACGFCMVLTEFSSRPVDIFFVGKWSLGLHL